MDPVVEQEEDRSGWENWLVLVSAWALLALCAVVTITVVTRWLYHSLIPDDVLVVRELMVAVILLPLAAVTARRAHIAVDVFTRGMKGRGARVLDLLGHLTGMIVVAFLGISGADSLIAAIESGDYHDGDLYIPMWLGYGVYCLALGAFAARLFWMIVTDVRSLFSHSC